MPALTAARLKLKAKVRVAPHKRPGKAPSVTDEFIFILSGN